ncbi:TPA: hypothetical protein DCG86_05045 [Candidatus Marinimicrobia bacterium]|nr:hypothetical protein [Candidatus Neomarinimicrobiota bacterium]
MKQSILKTKLFTGRPIEKGTMGKPGPMDMKRMVPVVLVVILLVLLLMLRNFRATIASPLKVFVSTIRVFGLMAVLGIPIYSVSTMIPVMLIAIGVAYGIDVYNHLVNTCFPTFLISNRETKGISRDTQTSKEGVLVFAHRKNQVKRMFYYET